MARRTGLADLPLHVGGKDGHPYPVDQPTYDASIEWLKEAVARARVGRTDRVEALRRLARWQAS